MLAVARSLGLAENRIHDHMNEVLLEGLASGLPLVKRFPEEHLLYIEAGHCVCALVVWAHHMLGLTVRVKLSRTQPNLNQDPFHEVKFGSAKADNVIIEVKSLDATPIEHEAAVMLQSCSTRDQIFILKVVQSALAFSLDGVKPVR